MIQARDFFESVAATATMSDKSFTFDDQMHHRFNDRLIRVIFNNDDDINHIPNT